MKLIKNKSYLISLLVIFMIGAFLFGVNQAKAVGDAYFPQDTTVTLDVGNFTIIGGSDADTVETNGTTTITVTISADQSFTLESADRRILANNGGFSYSCFSDKSSIKITSTTTRTIIITPQSSNCGSVIVSGGGGGGGGSVTSTPTVTSTPSSTPTPTPTAVSTPSPTPTSTPVSSSSATNVGSTPVSRGFVSLAAVSLQEGDVVSAVGSDDPDVYIVNSWGYKRLFLNPAIFKFYGHLGGFAKVKNTASSTRDTFVTSGLFRNCETNDEKVYGVETTGEDVGTLHWVNTTGEKAVADDPEFFKKVFCINSKEFNWYPKGSNYTSVNQIPEYSRTATGSGSSVSAVSKRVRVVDTTLWLNVRDGGSLGANIIGQALPGEEYDFLTKIEDWYNIKKDNVLWGWVFGKYVMEI